MSDVRELIGAVRTGGARLLLYKLYDIIFRMDIESALIYEISKNASESDYPRLLTGIYEMKTGKKIDINHPVTFNEKIQWLKLWDSTEIKTKLADKYRAREFIKEKVGEDHLIPLLGVWDNFDEIDFDALPDRFILKTNHGSGSNVVVDDKSKLNIREARDKFSKWMKLNWAYIDGFELHYKDIKPKIIAEEFIGDGSGMIDYRFFCFDGKPVQVWADKYSGTSRHIRSIYDLEWNKLDIKCCWPDGGNEVSQKPKNFDLMIESAKRLSEGFYFVRVDFYEYNGHMYVGELTFTPTSGFVGLEPEEADRKLGDMMNLPI